MALNESLDLLMFAALGGLLLLGYPVALTLGGTALAFALAGWAAGAFDMAFLSALPSRIFGAAQNEVLLAVPLFVFMGVMLERSRVAEELLDSMGRLFGHLRGGLGISVFVVGALLAASTGIVGATVVTMGLLSLPTMLKRGYDPALASGAIAASGTLGQIIPPSIVLVLLGDQIATAYQQSQLKAGNFSPDTVTVGDLFAGALIPGLMLVALYIAYQAFIATVRPSSSPPVPPSETKHSRREVAGRALRALIAPVSLIVAVLGSILAGLATPTEAAAVGALGATLLAGFKHAEGGMGAWPVLAATGATIFLIVLVQFADLRIARTAIGAGDAIAIAAAFAACALLVFGAAVSLIRVYRSRVLHAVMEQTAIISTMVFVILIGAAMFSLVFRGLGGDDTIHALLADLPGGATGAMAAVMLAMFVLGFFIDFVEIVFIVVPVVAPVLLTLGADPIWLGVMIGMNLQTSFLTPPFGFALFYLRGVAPPAVTTMHIYRGVIPFILIQIAALAVLWIWPELATWLPAQMFD